MIDKVYKCCICHTVLENKPHRLVYQEYEHRRFKNKHNFDFCDKCFKTFKYWIKKHKED